MFLVRLAPLVESLGLVHENETHWEVRILTQNVTTFELGICNSRWRIVFGHTAWQCRHFTSPKMPAENKDLDWDSPFFHVFFLVLQSVHKQLTNKNKSERSFNCIDYGYPHPTSTTPVPPLSLEKPWRGAQLVEAPDTPSHQPWKRKHQFHRENVDILNSPPYFLYNPCIVGTWWCNPNKQYPHFVHLTARYSIHW